MSYVPYKLVLWKIKYNMKCHSKLHNAKIRSQMSACDTYLINKKLAYLISKLVVFYWR